MRAPWLPGQFIDHENLVSGPCKWSASSAELAPGLTQSTNAWGNPGDNTLMGCNALYTDKEFTEARPPPPPWRTQTRHPPPPAR